MSQTFLQTVNRILRTNAVIRGDTDPVTSFSDTQHNASMNLAILATQNELVRLISDRLIPAERKTSGSLSLVASTRTYALATDFTRFFGVPHFYDSSANVQYYEYPGGLEALQIDDYKYATQTGGLLSWYWEPTTTKQVGFYQVPEEAVTLGYEYEGSVLVSLATDPLPFPNDEECYMFIEMASRRFKFLFEDVKNELDIQNVLERDTTYRSSKAALISLIKGTNAKRSYASVYG